MAVDEPDTVRSRQARRRWQYGSVPDNAQRVIGMIGAGDGRVESMRLSPRDQNKLMAFVLRAGGHVRR